MPIKIYPEEPVNYTSNLDDFSFNEGLIKSPEFDYGTGYQLSPNVNVSSPTKDFSMGDIASKWSNLSLGLIPGLEQHIENLPAIKATTSGPEYFQKSTADMIQSFSDAYGKAPIVGPLNQALIETTAPVLSAVTSLPYDFYEATQRMEPGSGIKGLYSAWQNEQPWTAMKNRFIGAAQPLANRITNVGTSMGEGIYGLMHGRQMRSKQRQLMNRRKQQMQQRIRQAEAAKQKAAADAAAKRQAQLQAQVTSQANREAKRRISQGEGRDYGKTETRASSGWESSPFNSGGLVDFYRYGGFIG